MKANVLSPVHRRRAAAVGCASALAASGGSAVSLVDHAVTTDVAHGYRVYGYDNAGDLVSYSDLACIVLAPG